MKKNILIVDDHPIVSAGLQTLIGRTGRYGRIFAAGDMATALLLLRQNDIGIAIIDLELHDSSGLELIKHIHLNHAGVKVVVYTMHEELWTIRQLMNEDADAIVMKGDNPQEILTALHMIEQGKGYFSQQFTRLINSQSHSQAALSERETEVLEHISNGLSTADISRQLNISKNTVEFHRHNLMLKLHAANVAQMVKKAMKMGLDFVRH